MNVTFCKVVERPMVVRYENLLWSVTFGTIAKNVR